MQFNVANIFKYDKVFSARLCFAISEVEYPLVRWWESAYLKINDCQLFLNLLRLAVF